MQAFKSPLTMWAAQDREALCLLALEVGDLENRGISFQSDSSCKYGFTVVNDELYLFMQNEQDFTPGVTVYRPKTRSNSGDIYPLLTILGINESCVIWSKEWNKAVI